MRLIFSAVAYALLMLLLVVAVTVPWGSQETVPPLSWALIGIGTLAGPGVLFVRRRELDCGDSERLVNGYRQRMLFGVALAEAPAILAFVAALIADQAWLYLVGLAVAAVALAMIAPTAGDLERKEAELRAQGCALSLRETLAASAKRQ